MPALVIDIETVPDAEIYTAPRPLPGEKVDFPPLPAHRVIAIGALLLDDDYRFVRIGIMSEGAPGESEMLKSFATWTSDQRPLIVTWNGRRFDLPVLMLRMLKYGLSCPWYYQDRDVRYRYNEIGHLDLCDALSDHGAAGSRSSLADVARLIGLPGKQGGVDGSKVHAMFESGQIEKIRNYCLSDVAQTAFVFLRYRLLTGAITLDTYRFAATSMLAALAEDGRLGELYAAINRERLLLATTKELP